MGLELNLEEMVDILGLNSLGLPQETVKAQELCRYSVRRSNSVQKTGQRQNHECVHSPARRFRPNDHIFRDRLLRCPQYSYYEPVLLTYNTQ